MVEYSAKFRTDPFSSPCPHFWGEISSRGCFCAISASEKAGCHETQTADNWALFTLAMGIAAPRRLDFIPPLPPWKLATRSWAQHHAGAKAGGGAWLAILRSHVHSMDCSWGEGGTASLLLYRMALEVKLFLFILGFPQIGNIFGKPKWEIFSGAGEALSECLCSFPPPSLSQLLQSQEKIYSDSLVTQVVRKLSAMWETWVQSLGQENPLEEGMAPDSSILAWRIPRTKEPGGPQSMGSQRVKHDWTTKFHTFMYIIQKLIVIIITWFIRFNQFQV